MAGAGEMRKFLCQTDTNIVTREENSKVAFESHYGKNSIRTAGKKKTTNKQTKNKTKAQQQRSRIFRKLRVTSAFPFETKKGIFLSHAHRALQS